MALKMITYNGKKQNIQKWSQEVGLKYSTLAHRLRSDTFTVEQALTLPVRQNPTDIPQQGPAPEITREALNAILFEIARDISVGAEERIEAIKLLKARGH